MRALAWFWAGLILIGAVGAGVLQWHGAPRHPATAVAGKPPVEAANPPVTPAPVLTGGPIAPPDPALQEPSAEFPGGFLPRIGPDHRAPMTVYAAAFDPAETRPMVAILLAGIGMSASDSDAAIIAAPSAVALAVSPYAVQPDALLAEARAHGHEYFLSIPMEPRGYPLDDAGNRALLTGNTPGANDQMLDWALTRFGGYVGATGALGALHGERFAESPTQFAPILAEVAQRGLMYIDPRPGAALPPGVVGRDVDVLVDEIPGAAEIDANLARLEDVAKARGSAIGLISVPRPVAIARLVAWSAGLSQRGLALAPVSEVARTPRRAIQAGAAP